jgi:type III pantothenate kinase
MSDTRLLVDIGNSRIKWVWAQGSELLPERSGHGEFPDLERACRPAVASRPTEVLMASVAGADRARQVAELCTVRWDLAPRMLHARAAQGGVRNGYHEAEKLGVDRWLAIVGAVARHGKPLIVWDLGTASTLDAVDADGRHLGGWILPGPATMLDALVRKTKLKVPEELAEAGALEPGRTTSECIRGGVLAAQAGALERFLQSLGNRLGENPRLVTTGGAAPATVERLGIDCVLDPLLVFRGMLVD